MHIKIFRFSVIIPNITIRYVAPKFAHLIFYTILCVQKSNLDYILWYLVKIIHKSSLIIDYFQTLGAPNLVLFFTQSPLEIFLKSGQDLRKFPRRISIRAVLFAAQNRYFAATTTNISNGGVFIETRDKFKKGQIITLVIARTKITKGVMLKGRVVHLRRQGFGLKFISLLKNGKEYKLGL